MKTANPTTRPIEAARAGAGPVASTKRHVRTLPGPRLILLVVGGSPLWLAALLPWGWTMGVLYWLVLAALSLRDYRRLPKASDLVPRRRLPPKFSLDSESEVRLTLRNRTMWALRLSLKDDPPRALQSLGDLPEGLKLPPRGAIQLTYRVRAVSRGAYAFAPLLASYSLPRGLLERRVAYELPDRVRIYPRLKDLGDYELLARIDEREEVVRRARRIRGSGTEFESLRRYVPGDDLRKVDWKASARRGYLISRAFQIERGQQIAILVDCGRLMAEKIGRHTRLDHAFNAAVMLSYVAQKRGDSVAMATFSNRVESFLPPTRGRSIMPSVLESIYRVQVRPVESDYWQVTAQVMSMLKKRSLVLMMTDLLDVGSSAGLINNLYRAASKHLVLCVVLAEPRVAQVAEAVPADAEEAYRKAAACHLSLERHLAQERLRSRGILVLESSPQRLSLQLVRKYLEIRRANLQ